jgi:hypothetical protein
MGRMNATSKIEAASLHTAMATAFGKIDAATKAKAGQVGQQKYKYADLAGVIDAIKPALVENGLFFTQQPMPAQGGVQIRTVLHHACGDLLDMGTLFVPANKNDAQGYGSALTYARRYALVTAFGVPTEDDDGNAAVKAVQGQSSERAVSPAPQPDYPFPDGPATGITQLKTMLRPLWRDIAGCDDLGGYLGLIEAPENREIIDQCQRLKGPHRELWEGDGKDNPGLQGHMAKRRAELEQLDNDLNAASNGQWDKAKGQK